MSKTRTLFLVHFLFMSSIGFVTETKVIQQPEEFLDRHLLGLSQNQELQLPHGIAPSYQRQ